MPFIHVYAYSGRDMETKIRAVQAIVKAAGETMGAPETSFTVAYEEVERADWEKDVIQAYVEPLGDKVLMRRGKLL